MPFIPLSNKAEVLKQFQHCTAPSVNGSSPTYPQSRISPQSLGNWVIPRLFWSFPQKLPSTITGRPSRYGGKIWCMLLLNSYRHFAPGLAFFLRRALRQKQKRHVQFRKSPLELQP